MSELEADFSQYYHLSIIEDLGASLSIWRACILCGQLPRKARSNIALDEINRWGEQEHLLADVIDSVQILQWIMAGANKAHVPKPIHRPGMSNQETLQAQTENISLEISELDKFLSLPREELRKEDHEARTR